MTIHRSTSHAGLIHRVCFSDQQEEDIWLHKHTQLRFCCQQVEPGQHVWTDYISPTCMRCAVKTCDD